MCTLQRQDRALNENNIQKGIKDLKSTSTIGPRRPVLNDISSNLQVNQNANQRGKIAITKPLAKPVTRLTAKYVFFSKDIKLCVND